MSICYLRFRDEGDDKSMEVGWKEMLAEEKRSARLGGYPLSLKFGPTHAVCRPDV